MGRYPASKFRLWVGQPVNAPFVTPPLSLRIFLVFCILSVIGTLIFAVSEQLLIGTTSSLSNLQMITIAVGYFVLPVIVAHTIATNRPISRLLIVLFVSTLTYRGITWIGESDLGDDQRATGLVLVIVSFVIALLWLYRSDRVRVYYSLIKGEPIPYDINRAADEVLSPGKFETTLSRVGRAVSPYTEFAIVLVILIGIIGGLSVYF